MGEGIPPPLALSLIVCDSHIDDVRTGQNTIVGIISHIQTFNFPVLVPKLCIFAEVTNGRGRMPMSIRIIDADEARQPVALTTFEAEFTDPIAINQLVMGLVGLIFPEPGEYRVQLLGVGELLLERRLVLVPLKPPTPLPGGPVTDHPVLDGPGIGTPGIFGPGFEGPAIEGPGIEP